MYPSSSPHRTHSEKLIKLRVALFTISHSEPSAFVEETFQPDLDKVGSQLIINARRITQSLSSSRCRLSPHFTTKINRGDPSLLSNNHLNDNERTHKEEWFV